MMPVQPVPVMATDPNYTGAPMMMPPYMPTNLINTPQNFIYFQDPMTEIAQSSGAIIRQQVELLEAVTGCETQNRYHVFLQTPMGLKYAFKCNERSVGCARCCLSGSTRPLQMVIRHVISFDQIDSDLAKIFINIDKPCTCGCCCLCRPYMDIFLADNNQYVGKVREPCTCCDNDVEIYDASGNFRYLITGDCCQLGLCCGSDVEKLANIRFDILEGGSLVGGMKKLAASSFGEFFTKADSYQVNFPANATPQEKILLIVAGLMIDYQFFENSSNDETPMRGYHHPYY